MNTNQFLEKAKEFQRPVVVDFWASWCAPCRMTKPILDGLAREYEEKVAFWAINADEHTDLMQELKIYGIPTLLLVNEGKIVGRFTGAHPEEHYRRLFDSLAAGETIQMPISTFDRLLRLGVGTASVVFALNNSTWWLLALGVVILFTGLYDRCPIWKAITQYFQNSKKTP